MFGKDDKKEGKPEDDIVAYINSPEGAKALLAYEKEGNQEEIDRLWALYQEALSKK